MLKAALSFRSEHHKDWFFGTTVLFIVGCGFSWFGISFVSWLWMCGHLLTALAAWYAIGFKRMRAHEYLSVDCIWYNSLMAAMNGGVALIARILGPGM